jgi:hypothetical protein
MCVSILSIKKRRCEQSADGKRLEVRENIRRTQRKNRNNSSSLPRRQLQPIRLTNRQNKHKQIDKSVGKSDGRDGIIVCELDTDFAGDLQTTECESHDEPGDDERGDDPPADAEPGYLHAEDAAEEEQQGESAGCYAY